MATVKMSCSGCCNSPIEIDVADDAALPEIQCGCVYLSGEYRKRGRFVPETSRRAALADAETVDLTEAFLATLNDAEVDPLNPIIFRDARVQDLLVEVGTSDVRWRFAYQTDADHYLYLSWPMATVRSTIYAVLPEWLTLAEARAYVDRFPDWRTGTPEWVVEDRKERIGQICGEIFAARRARADLERITISQRWDR